MAISSLFDNTRAPDASDKGTGEAPPPPMTFTAQSKPPFQQLNQHVLPSTAYITLLSSSSCKAVGVRDKMSLSVGKALPNQASPPNRMNVTMTGIHWYSRNAPELQVSEDFTTIQLEAKFREADCNHLSWELAKTARRKSLLLRKCQGILNDQHFQHNNGYIGSVPHLKDGSRISVRGGKGSHIHYCLRDGSLLHKSFILALSWGVPERSSIQSTSWPIFASTDESTALGLNTGGRLAPQNKSKHSPVRGVPVRTLPVVRGVCPCIGLEPNLPSQFWIASGSQSSYQPSIRNASQIHC